MDFEDTQIGLEQFTKKDVKAEIKELREKIEYYSKLYYEEDNSPISDYDDE